MRHPHTALRAAAALAGALVLMAAVLAGCSEGGRQAGTVGVARAIGQGEGALTLVTWPGYTEGGASDPRVDWVTPFQERTGCRVDIRYASSGADMVAQMSNPSRRFDGIAAPPEVAGQLIAAKQAVQINPDLVDGYKDLQPRLRGLLKKSGKVYGVPFVWGSNVLMYDPKVVQPAPTSWSALFDPAQAKKYAGRLVVRDGPLTIADAALYLKYRQPGLGISDPYELTPRQLTAVTDVLRKQHPYVKSYWTHPSDAISAFASGDAVLGEVWPYHVDVLQRAGRSIEGVTPREGVTGWLDSWMIGARAEHPNCMYQWLNWMTSPDVQQQVSEWTGVAPANPQACSQYRLNPEFCTTYHVNDRAYLDKVLFARTPVKECGRHVCTDYAQWTQAWSDAQR
ncbi:ABC transporter substrate-binding protein [Actinomadura scrupuli]|uniref:ABC transporter substrate-binding protein n=1 Tax=Actinomadura scrupuli TaxID=559629 RepID=UPI003D9862B1